MKHSNSAASLLAAMTLAAVTLCSSCGGQKTETTDETLPLNVLQQAPGVKLDTMDIGMEFPTAAAYLVYQDTILIVTSSHLCTDHFVEIVNLRTHQPVASLCAVGDGDGEVLSAQSKLMNGHLVVNDFVKAQVVLVDMDSLLTVPGYQPQVRKRAMDDAPTAVPFRGRLLAENPSCFSSRDLGIKQGVENGVPRFVELDGDSCSDVPAAAPFHTRNVCVDGMIEVSPDQQHVLYGSMGRSALEVYDDSLHLTRRVLGPVTLDECVAAMPADDSDTQEVSYSQRIPYAYTASCSSPSRAFFAYMGDYLEDGEEMKDKHSYVLVFDWDGTLLRACHADALLTSLSVSSRDSSRVYATALNAEGTPVLVTFSIDE